MKGGHPPLRRGLDRMLPDHRSVLGKRLRRDFDQLVTTLGVEGDLLLRETSRVAMLGLRAREANRRWVEVVEKRRVGRGRRPSPSVVERAARRAALDDETYTAALDRLRELAGARKAPSALDRLRELAGSKRNGADA